MIKIDYPDKKPDIKRIENKEHIFCMIRRRWFLLTPEEWVRQNFLLYITEVLGWPAKLIAVEKQIILTEVKKRFDIVVYDRQAIPFMIVECKELNEPLTPEVLNQVLRYNMKIRASLLVITNGSETIAYRNESGHLEEVFSLKEIVLPQ